MSYPPATESREPARGRGWKLTVEIVALLAGLAGIASVVLTLRSKVGKPDLAVTLRAVPYRVAPSAFDTSGSKPISPALLYFADGSAWMARLRNNGTARASNVTLSIAGMREAEVARESEHTPLRVAEDRAFIGDVAPGESLTIWAWTPGNDFDDFWRPDSVQLAYDSGILWIRPLVPLPAPYGRLQSILATLAGMWPWGFIFLATSTISLWGLTASMRARAQASVETQGPADPEPPAPAG